MATPTTHMTAADLLAMPADRSHLYELVSGELITRPPASGELGAIERLTDTDILTFPDVLPGFECPSPTCSCEVIGISEPSLYSICIDLII